MKNINDYFKTTLAENPEYYEEVLALIEKEFNYSEEYSFGEDFHLLINPLNFENSHFFIDKKSNSVVSHVAFCKREMTKNNISIPVVFIGGIATHIDFRGRGLFRELMNEILSENNNECALYFLWSEIPGLYEKFDFALGGGLLETGSAHFDLKNPPIGFIKRKFSELSNKEFNQIMQIYKENNEALFFTVKRTAKDWSLIKEVSSIDLFIKKNEAGNIQEYFCINKGKDLKNIIHEIGALPKHLPGLIKTIKAYKCWLPEYMEGYDSNKNELFYTAYIRLSSIELLNTFLDNISRGKLKIVSIDQEVSFVFQNEAFKVSRSEFIQFLFGPKMLKEFEEFGLSPYISGTDSI